MRAVERLVVAAALLIAACTSSFTVEVGDWTAICTGVSAADCEGVAGLFINNLARNSSWVQSENGGKVSVEPRRSCPKVPDWADPTSCWQATANVSAGAVCMVIARLTPRRRDPASARLAATRCPAAQAGLQRAGRSVTDSGRPET